MKSINDYKKEYINPEELKNGVFLAARGGGVRAVVAIGVLRALEEAKIPVKTVSGESLSSLFAALCAYGYSAEEILEYFLKYNNTITKAGKPFGGRGSIVIEEVINELTNGIQMKDTKIDCYINACVGKLLKPELVLFDEPTSALDPEMIGEVTNLMRDIAKTGITMIIVSHEMNFIKNFCTRVLYMENGKILEDGTSKQIFEKPKHPELISFLSKINNI